MISISHWGVFCPHADLSVAAQMELLQLSDIDCVKWFPACPGDFCIGPVGTWT